MKSKMFLTLAFVTSIINLSCEEDFNPKSELKDDYILNCTVKINSYNGDTPVISVKAVINRTYDTDGFIPKGPDSSMFVPGANVTLFSGPKPIEYTLCDSIVLSVPGDSCFIVRFKHYIPTGAVPNLQGNDKLRIIVRMPDGKLLSAETITPRIANFELSRVFEHGITTDINKFKWGNALTISWGDPVQTGHLYFPKFQILYSIKGDKNPYSAEISTKYVKRNNKNVPLYAGAIYVPEVSYEYASIDSAMKNLAPGVNRSDIKIICCSFTLTEYDRNLSALYSSTNGFLDSYSVRLDENIYTNVTGGLGVFGSYCVNKNTYLIDREYIQSFGYEY